MRIALIVRKMSKQPTVKIFFDEATSTFTYLVFDPVSKDAVIIDSVLDFDPITWRTSTASADALASFVEKEHLEVHWLMDTHAHADHLSAMAVLKKRLGAKTAISLQITAVQEVFAGALNLANDFACDGSQFDKLLADGESVSAGTFDVEALHTPGHTPACVTYRVGDAIFTGDVLLMPDQGTGRCDFPRGSAEAQFASITSVLYRLPVSTRVFVGHDYRPGGREYAYETTIGDSKKRNKMLRSNTQRNDFIASRQERDATLAPPKLIFQSIQVNINAGQLPAEEGNGQRYMKIPINFLGS